MLDPSEMTYTDELCVPTHMLLMRSVPRAVMELPAEMTLPAVGVPVPAALVTGITLSNYIHSLTHLFCRCPVHITREPDI